MAQSGAVQAPEGADPWLFEALQAGDLGRRGPHGSTLAHVACCSVHAPGGLQLLARLISAGAPLGERDEDGRTPAHHAAASGHAAALQALAGAGVPLGEGDADGETPAHWAAHVGHVEAVEALAGAGVPLGERNNAGRTPAHFAAQAGHAEALEALARAGASLGARATNGITPAHSAAGAGHVQALEELARVGVPLGERDADGWTPAHWAAVGGHVQALEALARMGAPLGERDASGWTPAHCAAAKGRTAALEVLDLAGADLDAHTDNGSPPAATAACAGHVPTMRMLWLAGADCDDRCIPILLAKHGLAGVFVDATPAKGALRRARAAARRGELRAEHAALLEEVVGCDALAGTTICVTRADLAALEAAVRLHDAAAEPYLAQRAEVQAALLPALAACLHAQQPAASPGARCFVPHPAAQEHGGALVSEGAAATTERAMLDEGLVEPLGSMQLPDDDETAKGTARRAGRETRLHAPATSMLQLLRSVAAARARAEALRAEAPRWLRDSVSKLVEAMVALRDQEASG